METYHPSIYVDYHDSYDDDDEDTCAGCGEYYEDCTCFD